MRGLLTTGAFSSRGWNRRCPASVGMFPPLVPVSHTCVYTCVLAVLASTLLCARTLRVSTCQPEAMLGARSSAGQKLLTGRTCCQAPVPRCTVDAAQSPAPGARPAQCRLRHHQQCSMRRQCSARSVRSGQVRSPSSLPSLPACLLVPARVGCWPLVRGPSRLLFDAQTNELLCTGAVSGPAPMVLRCPARETITKLEFARFGKSTDPSGPDGWYCYGPQPPPFAKAVCGADVAGKLAGLCVGRNTCDLSASSAKLDNPCAPPLPPNNCPPGQHMDYVEAPGDNGSCDCDIFCAADWDNQIKAARPHWTGATSLGSNTTTSCRCVQATHWCPHGKAGGCAAACDKVGKPKAAHVCVTGPVPPPPTDPNLQLIVRVACSGGSATPFATPTAVDDLNELGSGQVLATVNITVPGGSHGEVHVPIMSADSGTITQSGRVVWSKGKAASSLPRGLSFMANDGRRFAMFATGAGSWSFVSAV